MKEKEFYRKKLDSGTVVLFEKRKIPVAAVSTSVKFGSEYEQEKIKGISHFIEHLVFKGTKKRTVNQISEDIEKKGGILNAFTSEEITCYWNKLPSKHLFLGIEHCSDLVLNPLFESEALERERKVILEEIKMYHDNPQFYVLEKIKELLYEKPFGMFTAGTHKTMSEITRQQVLGIFNSVYSPNRMILTVVGKADFDEICENAEKIFPKSKKQVIERDLIKINRIECEKRKGIDQAHMVFAFHVPGLQDKRRYAAEVLDTVLAQGMSSRLWREIREKRGLAYAVKGFLEQDKNYGHEIIYVGALKEKIKEIRELILKEFKKVQAIEKKEIEEAKEQLIGLRDIESEDSVRTMTNLITEENAGNAEEYYKYKERIKEVKLKDVQDLAKLKKFSFISLIPE